jgi:uracil-DNA glycosylase
MIRLYKSFSKAARFNDLVESVQHCDLCPRLRGCRKVLSSANGNVESKVLFVAEAPGRLGADRTGVPLFGDRTGDNFEALLGNIGWRRFAGLRFCRWCSFRYMPGPSPCRRIHR